MTEFKHTQGPWRVIYYDAGDYDHYDLNGPCPSIQAPDELDCAIVHWDGFKQKHWSACNGDQKQIEANAHLIAAAPELLDALQEWVAGYDGWSEYELARRTDTATIKRLKTSRTAIKKARGE